MFLIDEIDAVDDAVAALATASIVGFEQCPDATITSALWEAERDANRLAAARIELASTWIARKLYRQDGSRSPSSRLARDTGCSKESADRMVRRAKKLRTMPLVSAAFTRGDLSEDKVDLLCTANGKKRRVAFAEAEARLLGDAERLGHADLKRVLEHWSNAADDAIGDDQVARDVDGAHLSVSGSYRGTVVIDGRLDPLRGVIVQNELERLADELFAADWEATCAELGDDATVDQIRRTPTQRRAEALSIMAQRSRAMAPGSTLARPLFTVLVDHPTAGRICELANGTAIAPGHLAPFLSAADLERVVFGPDGRVLDVGRRSRFFRGGLRRAIEVRDRRCTFPGCDTPAERCDVDHVVEWGDGGETTQENGRLRCGPHNRQRPGRTDASPPGPDDDHEDDIADEGDDPAGRPPIPGPDARSGTDSPGTVAEPDGGTSGARERPGADPPAHGPPT